MTFQQGMRGGMLGILALASLGGLSACSEQNGSSATQAGSGGNSDAVAGSELQAKLEALEAGQSTLRLAGDVTSVDEGARDSVASEDIYRPALGGGASRRGSNAEGPYALSIYTDAVHQADPDETVRARVSLVLPEGASAGRSYTIATFSDADDDQVQAHVRGHGEIGTFGRQVQGSLYLAELGDQASAAWRLEAADGRDEEALRVEAEGAVKGLAFSPQREAHYEITVNGDTEQYLGRVSIHETPNDYVMSIGNRITLDVPVGVDAGEYALASQADDGVIRVSLMRHEVEEIEGSIRFSERDGVFDAELAFQAAGEDEVSLSGGLEGLEFEQ